MIALAELAPPRELASRVEEAEYSRLLGYPEARLPAGRVRDLAAASRAWYAAQGRPWARARLHAVERISGERIELAGGEALTSPVLADRLAAAGAGAVVATAVSAGSEVDCRSAELWAAERPDEAYFLDRFGTAVVEYLAAWLAGELRAGTRRLAALPAYSPGYPGWELAEQQLVARCLRGAGDPPLPPDFTVLETGMTRPRSTLLAVFGLTERRAAADAAWRRLKCSWCSLASCGLRRAG